MLRLLEYRVELQSYLIRFKRGDGRGVTIEGDEFRFECLPVPVNVHDRAHSRLLIEYAADVAQKLRLQIAKGADDVAVRGDRPLLNP